LAAIAAELAEARNQATPATAAADEAQLSRMFEEIRQQRAEMKAAQEAAAQIQAERLAGLTAELSTVRSEMALVREEIGRRHEAIERSDLEEAARQHAEELTCNEFQEQLRRLERQQGMLEQEKQLLESELESVRNRAVEMASTLAEQKREAAQQQNQWADELKRMRRLLEDMSHRLAGAVPAATASAAPSAAPPPAAAAIAPNAATVAGKTASSGEDPVLESVLAQFEMLQRDLARRRADGVTRAPGI
jgi:chromosome segregation ATPase